MNSNAELKQRIHKKLFEGSWGSEIEIPDDNEDDDDVQEISPPKAKTRNPPAVGSLSQQTRVTRIPRGRRAISIEEKPEARERPSHPFHGLGDLGPRALRTNREMPYGRQPGKFTPPVSGLKVTNTLTNKSVPSKDERSRSGISRTQDRSDLTLKKAPPSQLHRPISKEGRPSKRLRTQSPERRTESYAQHDPVTRKTNPRAIDSVVTGARPSIALEVDTTDTSPSHTTHVRYTPMRKMAPGPPIPNEGRKIDRSNSPDHLFGTNLVDRDEADFTRAARLERERRASDSDEDYSHRKEPRATRLGRKPRPTMNGEHPRDSASSNPIVKPAVTPRVSKMTSRLDQESPDVLQSSVTLSTKPKRPFASPSRSPPLGKSQGIHFDLKRFIGRGFFKAEAYNIEINEKTKELSILYKDPGVMKDSIMTISISKIVKMEYPADDEGSNIVKISLSSGVFSENQCFLDFGLSIKTRAEFLALVIELGSGIKLQSRDRWIDDAMHNAVSRNDMDPQSQRRRNTPRNEDLKKAYDMSDMPDVLERLAQPRDTKKVRKVDQLDAGPIRIHRESETGTVLKEVPSNKHPNRTREGVIEAGPLTTRTRDTRSRVVKHPQEKADTTPRVIDVKPRRVGPAWDKPLVYPPIGKARATVTWDDLDRLNDEEFLNDNLIGLFMRYLQENMDQELAKKMHFFSTFFYNSLTRQVEKGKGRQINYDAVANWTKNVNLFNRDYVIVPVNESVHWYVMIICNLRNLKEPLDQHEDEDVIGINVLKSDGEVTSGASKNILESDLVEKEDVLDGSDYGDGLKVSEQPPSKKRPGRRKSHQNRLQKYSVNAPVIITLDSLGLARSNTASALKSYVIAEADDKYDLEVDKDDIKGMTAKNIPLQGNFSDCGLYLCMYLEQFVRDPKKFVRSILQREDASSHWPSRMENGVLRERFYDLLQKLYQKQVKERLEELPRIGNILIKDDDYKPKEMPPKDIYEPANVKAGVEFYEQHKARENKTTVEDRMLLDDEALMADRGLHINGLTKVANGSTNEPILVEDSQEQDQRKDGTSSRYFQQHTDTSRPPTADKRPDTPQALAEKLKRARSPRKGLAQTLSETSIIDITTPISRTSPHKAAITDNANGRRERETSCSTDYLTSNRIYQETNEIRQHPIVDSANQNGGPDDMEGVEAEEFNGFDDDMTEPIYSRRGSVVPESVQDENENENKDHDMLMH